MLFFLVIFLHGCSAKPYAVNNLVPFSGIGSNEIFVVSHGWHTGLVVSAGEIFKILPKLESRFWDVEYIEFGWGDRGFYQAGEITSGLTMRAILWPTEPVVHAVSVPENPYDSFSASEIEKLSLTDQELSPLLRFIASSFYRDDSGEIVELSHGIYGDSQFYKGAGDYYLMNTCNKWTAKGLQSAGMDISPAFKLTAGSVMSYLRQLSMP